MIGRKEWFNRRKYSGWGLTPRTWQGFAYIGAIVLGGFILSEAPIPSGLKMIISSLLIILVIADVLHIMATIKVDERESKIEALAERNASWTMVGALGILLMYFSMVGDSLTGKDLMPFIVFPMVAGMIVKAISAYILRNKEL
jgi:hypothetical protein